MPPEQGTPVFRSIAVRNLRVTNCAAAGRLAGLPESPSRNIRLENVISEARRGFTIHYTEGLQLENVTVNGELVKAPALPAVTVAH